MLTLTLKEGCDKIEKLPFCLTYREVDEFNDRQPKPTEAPIEATTPKPKQPDLHNEEIMFIFLYIYI